jgi:hypothetical protein
VACDGQYAAAIVNVGCAVALVPYRPSNAPLLFNPEASGQNPGFLPSPKFLFSLFSTLWYLWG